MKHTLLAAALLAAGCATTPYDQPYAIISTEIAPSADPLVHPVIVNRIDDRNAWPPHAPVVAPGAHQVTIDLPPRRGFPATQRTFEVVAEPCTRYYVAAHLHSMAGQAWDPIVRSREPIGDCRAKFAAR